MIRTQTSNDFGKLHTVSCESVEEAKEQIVKEIEVGIKQGSCVRGTVYVNGEPVETITTGGCWRKVG